MTYRVHVRKKTNMYAIEMPVDAAGDWTAFQLYHIIQRIHICGSLWERLD